MTHNKLAIALAFGLGLLLPLLSVRITPAGVPDPKIVILEFHGMMQGTLTEDLEGLPNFQELIRGPNNEQSYIYIPQVLTTIPSASQPAVTSMYTGLYPQRTGVVSTIWFDRSRVATHTLISYSQQRINHILALNGVKSIFDMVAESSKRSMTSMLMLTKGTDWPIRSGAFFWGNASLLGWSRNRRLIPDSRYVDEHTVRGFLTGHIAAYHKSLSGIQRYHRDIPDLMVVQLLGIDLFSHYPALDLEKRQASMSQIQKWYAQAVLDPLIGKLIGDLKRMGCYENIIFVLVSEHGFTRITRHIRDDIVDQSLAPHFKLPKGGRSEQQAEAVIMPGACTKEVYLKNRQSGAWEDAPRLLDDVKPAVDALLDNLELRDCIKALLIRQYPGERHEGLKESDQWWVFDWRSYRTAAKENAAFLMNLRPLDQLAEDFELGQYLTNGLSHQYTKETAPDIQLINKKGYYFVDDFNKYGHHGSYYRDDCIVSFWLAGPGLARLYPGQRTLERTVSTLDLVPMVTHLLGVKAAEGLDGSNPLANLQQDRSGIQ